MLIVGILFIILGPVLILYDRKYRRGLLNGYIHASGKVINVKDIDIGHMEDRQSHLLYCYQHTAREPHKSVAASVKISWRTWRDSPD